MVAVAMLSQRWPLGPHNKNNNNGDNEDGDTALAAMTTTVQLGHTRPCRMDY